MPLPRDDATPPVTKMCLVKGGLRVRIGSTQPRETTLSRDLRSARGWWPDPREPRGPVDEEDHDGEGPSAEVEDKQPTSPNMQRQRHQRVVGRAGKAEQQHREGEHKGQDERD